ncbi:MAG: hypothetical protein JW969_05200 [Spirochaetales bacterium]|nr:hypothetical protein [Spirochaetales bacterium]
MKKIACTAVLFFALHIVILLAQEYRLIGDLTFENTFHWSETGYKNILDPSDPLTGFNNWLTSAFILSTQHRFTMDKTEVFAHYGVSVNKNAEFTQNLYQAYFLFRPVDGLTLCAGKQRLNWGTGYLFSPSDKINPTDDFFDISQTGRHGGFTGITATYNPSADFTLTACLNTNQDFNHLTSNFWTDFRYAVYASLLLGELDLFTGFIYQQDEVLRPGFGFSFDLAGIILNMDASIELSNRIYYPDKAVGAPISAVTWTQQPAGQPYFSVEGGIEKIFSGEGFAIQFLVEYLYNSAGYGANQTSLFLQSVDYLVNNDPVTLQSLIFPDFTGQHYLVCTAGLEITGVLSFGNNILINIINASFLAEHSLTLMILEGIDLYARVRWTYKGQAHVEFDFLPANLSVYAGAVLHF